MYSDISVLSVLDKPYHGHMYFARKTLANYILYFLCLFIVVAAINYCNRGIADVEKPLGWRVDY